MKRAVTKPDLGNGVSHPARFSLQLINEFADILKAPLFRNQRPIVDVLDPFAGTGRIHLLRKFGFTTTGVEIEPEWAAMSEGTIVGDATAMPFDIESFDAIVTSPCYGNRIADHHKAKDSSVRRTYTHDLGRDLTENNAGAMRWGRDYQKLHRHAWIEAWRVMRPGGLFVLNVKDHMRTFKKGEPAYRQFVAGWHVSELSEVGFTLLFHTDVKVRSLRVGSNADVRLPTEQIYVFQKDERLP